jgi:HSP20 family protein
MAAEPTEHALSRTLGQPMPESKGDVSIDIAEADTEIVVQADLPGLKAEDIEVSIVRNVLRPKGEFEAEDTRERDRMWIRDCRFGRFQRYANPPGSVDADAADAESKNGVLRV